MNGEIKLAELTFPSSRKCMSMNNSSRLFWEEKRRQKKQKMSSQDFATTLMTEKSIKHLTILKCSRDQKGKNTIAPLKEFNEIKRNHN